jgi:RNA polymerase sigma factor (sigma-70 family)
MSSRKEFRATLTPRGRTGHGPWVCHGPDASAVSMSGAEPAFATWMRQLQAGNPEVERTVIARYSPHLRRVIRQRLHRRLRSPIDAEDLLQEVWVAFFTRCLKQCVFPGVRCLLAFLEKLAHGKVAEAERRYLHTAKCDRRRECSLHDLSPAAVERLIDPAPAPPAAAAAQEWMQYVHDQPVRDRQILSLLAEGRTQREVAAALHVSERTVRRVCRRLARQESGSGPASQRRALFSQDS